MTTHLAIMVVLAVALLALVRARLIQVDLLLPWSLAIAVLGFASTSPRFVDWLGGVFGILYPPIAVVFLVLFLQLGIIISLSVLVTRLRERLAALVRHQALRELAEREALLRAGSRSRPG